MFSSRLPRRLGANRLSDAVAAARRSGHRFIDLTETNPTRVGLAYPAGVTAWLGDPAGLGYSPDPLGVEPARRAVGPDPGRIVLTASTSEAYSFLFKLLCDPGDAVLVPRPSYPLFELLTRLDGIEDVPYRLDFHGGWVIDRDSVRAALTSRTRAILVVSPNNPTGSMITRDEREWLVALAVERGLAIIADEVFADYPHAPPAAAVSMAGESRVLTFTLGGLSKSAGLPQMKLAWIVANGPAPGLDETLERLAVIADSYLSVSTPVQLAAASLLAAGRTIRHAIRLRVARNLAALRAAADRAPVLTIYPPAGGWSAVVRVPAILSDDEFALSALAAGVLVHPGYFFDLEGDGFLVLSLLPEPAAFDAGLDTLLATVSGIAR